MTSLPAPASPAFGFFGKVPATGDFVSRGLGRSQVAIVDNWFQEGLTELARRDDDWLTPYLVAPVWSFVIPAGQWGELPQCGAIMASVDRVGRYFPLIALAELAEASGDQNLLCAQLRALAVTMPEVLQELLAPDAFEERLSHLADRALDISLARPSVLERFQQDGHLSAWWALCGPGRPYMQLSHRGIPDNDLFCRLFAREDMASAMNSEYLAIG